MREHGHGREHGERDGDYVRVIDGLRGAAEAAPYDTRLT